MSVDFTPVALSRIAGDLQSCDSEFFGIEVVRHSPATLEHRLRQLCVRPLRAAVNETAVGVAGYAINPANHRQVTVSVSTADPEHVAPVLRALVELLWRTARMNSFVAILRADSPAAGIYRTSGFTETGRLPQRRYRAYGYHTEVILHYAYGDDRPCES